MEQFAAFGPALIASYPYTDRHLKLDPDYTGAKTRNPPGRITDAYMDLHSSYGELFFGAIGRNWGVPGLDGLLTSSYATPTITSWPASARGRSRPKSSPPSFSLKSRGPTRGCSRRLRPSERLGARPRH